MIPSILKSTHNRSLPFTYTQVHVHTKRQPTKSIYDWSEFIVVIIKQTKIFFGELSPQGDTSESEIENYGALNKCLVLVWDTSSNALQKTHQESN